MSESTLNAMVPHADHRRRWRNLSAHGRAAGNEGRVGALLLEPAQHVVELRRRRFRGAPDGRHDLCSGHRERAAGQLEGGGEVRGRGDRLRHEKILGRINPCVRGEDHAPL